MIWEYEEYINSSIAEQYISKTPFGKVVIYKLAGGKVKLELPTQSHHELCDDVTHAKYCVRNWLIDLTKHAVEFCMNEWKDTTIGDKHKV
jgi:hypothetical protein